MTRYVFLQLLAALFRLENIYYYLFRGGGTSGLSWIYNEWVRTNAFVILSETASWESMNLPLLKILSIHPNFYSLANTYSTCPMCN